MWQEIHRKVASPEFSIQVELQHAKQQVWMRLEGAMSAADAAGLAHRLQESLARSKNRLVLDLKKLRCDHATDLTALRVRLATYRSRIRVVLPELAQAHPELLSLARTFQPYKV